VSTSEEIAVVSTLWEMHFPGERVPDESFLWKWIRYHSVDDIAEVLRLASDRHTRRPLRNPGAFVTTTLRAREQ
jgi:hypothetical protein